MDLNRAHALEDRSLVLVGVAAQDETVTNLKCVSFLRCFLFEELARTCCEIVLRKLRII